MKTISQLLPAGRLAVAGLFVTLAGCSAVSTRQQSEELSTSFAGVTTSEANIQPPAPLATVLPQYPLDLKRSGTTGVVHVNLLIDETGRVAHAAIDRTSFEGFAQPALNAVKKWTFTPGKRDGVIVPMRITLPIVFQFEDDTG
ncbi:MAG: energy transducer TonB [Opitutaceae bacterium]|nr:energy transducer TonB [Opitutaceae bacterium]